ncbi:type II secretion system F family protein [Methanocaldococcus indicus]|uniref:type II secretion system F family protein n=1 Tax=Methanocaldococcus indicus TaxID=213231 RepID=UPI003C6D6B55
MEFREILEILYYVLIKKNTLLLKKCGYDIKEKHFILLVLISIIFGAFFGYFLSLSFRGIVLMCIIYFCFVVSYPKIIYENLIEKLEKNISKALYIMVLSLESGRSINDALKDVVNSDIKVVSPIFKKILLLMEKQKIRFEEAITIVSSFYDSKVLKMLSRIIIENRKSGGNLSESLRILAKTLDDFHLFKRQLLSVTATGIATGFVMLCLVVPAVSGILGGYIIATSSLLSQTGKAPPVNPEDLKRAIEIVQVGTAMLGALFSIPIFGLKIERMFQVSAITMTLGVIIFYLIVKFVPMMFKM